MINQHICILPWYDKSNSISPNTTNMIRKGWPKPYTADQGQNWMFESFKWRLFLVSLVENKFEDWQVLLTSTMYQNWYFVQWWTGITREWLGPYNTDKGQIWMFEIINWRLFLVNQNTGQSWGWTSLIENFGLNLQIRTLSSAHLKA